MQSGKPTNFLKWVLLLLTLIQSLLISACQTPAPSAQTKIEIVIQQQWQGDFPADKMTLFPAETHKAGTGFINNPQILAAIWPYFQPGQPVPSIDFTQQLLVYAYNTEFYNRNRLFKIELSNGTANVLAMETLSARPIEDKLSMTMGVIPKQGITAVDTRDGLLTIPTLTH